MSNFFHCFPCFYIVIAIYNKIIDDVFTNTIEESNKGTCKKIKNMRHCFVNDGYNSVDDTAGPMLPPATCNVGKVLYLFVYISSVPGFIV